MRVLYCITKTYPDITSSYQTHSFCRQTHAHRLSYRNNAKTAAKTPAAPKPDTRPAVLPGVYGIGVCVGVDGMVPFELELVAVTCWKLAHVNLVVLLE